MLGGNFTLWRRRHHDGVAGALTLNGGLAEPAVTAACLIVDARRPAFIIAGNLDAVQNTAARAPFGGAVTGAEALASRIACMANLVALQMNEESLSNRELICQGSGQIEIKTLANI
ncbi:hypothetical protein FMN63_09900 [Stappia sp. BW2]|uniref:hypothetical protein n=1 Tax=Stappia sp. BW2 TaxID=2592622 RepID=UPI0011DEF014|nr:hypothetical protein [Stappia sp. BW2]TYC68945.1 hypothetical protein FMN63_09900 [Stappia sp. BW2]